MSSSLKCNVSKVTQRGQTKDIDNNGPFTFYVDHIVCASHFKVEGEKREEGKLYCLKTLMSPLE